MIRSDATLNLAGLVCDPYRLKQEVAPPLVLQDIHRPTNAFQHLLVDLQDIYSRSDASGTLPKGGAREACHPDAQTS